MGTARRAQSGRPSCSAGRSSPCTSYSSSSRRAASNCKPPTAPPRVCTSRWIRRWSPPSSTRTSLASRRERCPTNRSKRNQRGRDPQFAMNLGRRRNTRRERGLRGAAARQCARAEARRRAREVGTGTARGATRRPAPPSADTRGRPAPSRLAVHRARCAKGASRRRGLERRTWRRRWRMV